MIKKKEAPSKPYTGKRSTPGQGSRQTPTRGISSLTAPIFGNFIEDEWDSFLPRKREAGVAQALAEENR